MTYADVNDLIVLAAVPDAPDIGLLDVSPARLDAMRAELATTNVHDLTQRLEAERGAEAELEAGS